MLRYEERTYRDWVKNDDLVTVRIIDEETDLLVSGVIDLKEQASISVSYYRNQIKDYIAKDHKFLTALKPINVAHDAPKIVMDMADASRLAGVGPMSAVAGAIAEFVAKDLMPLSDQIIIENGGDNFIKSSVKRIVGIYAGKSPFTGKIGLQIEPDHTPIGICTSSGTVGHSLSFGRADAVIILSKWTALADAVATATGNVVKTENDIEKGINFARSIDSIEGVVIIVGSKIGIWGNINIVKTEK
ncbi:MAG: UPF0280 family protein [Candidatus Poribacteria bacterium]